MSETRVCEASEKLLCDYFKEAKNQFVTRRRHNSEKEQCPLTIHLPEDHSLKQEVRDELAVLLKRYVTSEDAVIVDIGCGESSTGLSLKTAGFPTIDGINTCHHRRDIAVKSNHYRDVQSKPLTEKQKWFENEDKYDGGFCASAITAKKCHFKHGLKEMCRVIKPGGYAAFTVNCLIEENAMHEVFRKLTSKRGRIMEVVHLEQKTYGIIDGVEEKCYACLIKIL